MARNFSTVLVANRGEIALRVMRTAHAMGLDTVAVFSEADRDSPHVAFATRAFCIGPPAPSASYLDKQRIVEAALATGADAVHPGYGFLAENADFAQAVTQAGLVFVGPGADAIRLMGDKAAAKDRMQQVGVPCIPGYQGASQEDEAFVQAAREIGFPVMVKSAAGGGGRGMRLVREESAFLAALRSARSEALAAFGSSFLILERAIEDARHIEVQVFADTQGNVLHLGERDCSVQRRHQKLIEESPSPAVDAALREKMGAAAVAAARSIGYVGAGTIEFLLAPDGRFFFMEMNTRLQVEHAVTEMRAGIDLVEWQLRVARGEPLPLAPHEVRLQGHAMEVRVCAEDAANQFLPQTGEVLLWEPDAGVRVDAALAPGLEIGPWYDSMLAKLVAFAPTREDCIARLAHACRRTVLLGVRHNLSFLDGCLRHPEFMAGQATTAFVGRNFPMATPAGDVPALPVLAAAAMLFAGGAWTNAQGIGSRVRLALAEGGGEPRSWMCSVVPAGSTLLLAIGDGASCRADAVASHLHRSRDAIAFEIGGARHRLRHARGADGSLWLHFEGRQYRLRNDLFAAAAGASAALASGGMLRAPFAGRVLQVHARAGAPADRDEVLVVLDSMKMEHALPCPARGVVEEVLCAVGEQVAAGQPLVRLGTEAARKPRA